MFYLTSKFHDKRVNTFGFMEEGGEEGGGEVFEARRPGHSKKKLRFH